MNLHMDFNLYKDKDLLGIPASPTSIVNMGGEWITPGKFSIEAYDPMETMVVIVKNKLLTMNGLRLAINTNFDCPFNWQLTALIKPIGDSPIPAVSFRNLIKLVDNGKYTIRLHDVYLEEKKNLTLMERLLILIKHFDTVVQINKVDSIKDIEKYFEENPEVKTALLRKTISPVVLGEYRSTTSTNVILNREQISLLKERT